MESPAAADARPEPEPVGLGTPAAVLCRPVSADAVQRRVSAATLNRITEAAAVAAVEAFYGRQGLSGKL